MKEKMYSLPKLMTFELIIVVISTILVICSSAYSYSHDYIIAYGDAESHLNIAKRVVSSITPGFSQLGGIWLPLPHIFLIPFVFFDPLWTTGIAGSIVSGISYVIACLFIYKLGKYLTKSALCGFMSFIAFGSNPNIVYLATTPMTELPLIMFFILSVYFFLKFLGKSHKLTNLILAAFFAFIATLTRYDGWFLVLIEFAILCVLYFINFFDEKVRKQIEGTIFIFSTLAFFGIFIWLLWDFLILGDPLYFSNSSFSAKSQQQGWLAKGELPTYHNFTLSFLYYLVASYKNIGFILSLCSVVGLFYFFKNTNKFKAPLIILLLFTPFIFYVTTLYMGQSIIFIPELTPSTFSWNLFNVRYGAMMVGPASIFFGYMFYYRNLYLKHTLILLLILQVSFFCMGIEKVITWEDGITGLSHAKRPDVEKWMKKNYDQGLVLEDDYSRTASIIRSGIPMQNIIYIGNKPYWEESLVTPEKYATWIIVQKEDMIWQRLYENPKNQKNLYKYFVKAYTSPEIMVFKRNESVLASK